MKKIVFIVGLVICFVAFNASAQLEDTEKNALNDFKRVTEAFKPTQAEKNYGAVILKRDKHHYANEELEYIDTHSQIAILNEAAANDLSRISVAYNAYFYDIELIYARVLTESGQVLNVNQDAVQNRAVRTNDNYSSYYELQFSIPALKENTFLEFKYRLTQKKPVIPGYWSTRYYLNAIYNSQYESGYRIAPIRQLTISYDVPEHKAIQLHQYNNDKINIDVNQKIKNGRKWIVTTAKNIPGYEIEQGSPFLDDVLPIQYMTTLQSWQDVVQWGKEKYVKQAPKKVQQLAASIAKDANSVEEKVKAIYHYLQRNLRYISADFASNGVIPADMQSVLDNRYGDCKDQANLFAAMLRSINIDAYPAVINPRGFKKVKKENPAMNFIHMITYVPALKENKWIDLVGDKYYFPGLDYVYYDQTALVFFPDEVKLVKTSDYNEIDDSLNIYVKKDISENPLKIKVTIDAKGPAGLRLKHRFSHAANQELKSLFAGIYNGQVLSAKLIGGDDVTQPFKATAQIVLNDKWDPETGQPVGASLSQLIKTWSSVWSLQPDDNRTQPFYLMPGHFKLFVEAKGITQGRAFISNQQGIASNNEFFTTSVDIKNDQDYKLKMEFRFIDQVIAADKFNVFIKVLNDAINVGHWVSYYKNVEGQTVSYKKDVASSDIDEIKTLIDDGAYDKANVLIKQYLKNNPQSGQGYYLSGLVNGLLGNFGLSEEDFQKAKSLGYTQQ